MANTNSSPPTVRLSRSTSDRQETGHQRPPNASSSRSEKVKDKLPQAKIQALEQFVKFGRKGKQKEKEKEPQRTSEVWPTSTSLSTDAITPIAAVSAPSRRVSRRDTSQTPHRADTASSQVPRPIPNVSLNTISPAADITLSSLGPSGANLSPPIQGANGANALLSSSGARGATTSIPEAPDNEEQIAPEPLTLARRIQDLLSFRTIPPTPSATDATTSGTGSSETGAPVTPGSPIPPAPGTDSRLLALLGNTNVMSGSTNKRQSVFEILDRLRRPSGRTTDVSNDLPSAISEEEEQDNEEYEDDSSIMLYGPIVPSEDSEVELAASDIMSVFDDGETLEFERPAHPISFFDSGEHLTPRSPPASVLPETPEERDTQQAPTDDSQPCTQKEPETLGWFDTWKGKVIEGGKLVSEKVAEGTKSWTDKISEGRKVVKTKTRWVPSPDKISFQATWWGYRLCVHVTELFLAVDHMILDTCHPLSWMC